MLSPWSSLHWKACPCREARRGEGQNELTTAFPWPCPSTTPNTIFLPRRISQIAEAGSGPIYNTASVYRGRNRPGGLSSSSKVREQRRERAKYVQGVVTPLRAKEYLSRMTAIQVSSRPSHSRELKLLIPSSPGHHPDTPVHTVLTQVPTPLDLGKPYSTDKWLHSQSLFPWNSLRGDPLARPHSLGP